MGNTWGTALRLAIFGESHGPAIGITVDGLPPGEAIDMEAVAQEMQRRAPGRSELATPRREADEVELLSGIYEGRTTGFPVCGMIRNGDARSRDYDSKLRPGHADMTALLKYAGHADMRGGGHFSGRLTAPLVFAGALAKQVLQRHGVVIGGRIAQIGNVEDTAMPEGPEAYATCSDPDFPVLDAKRMEKMRGIILKTKEAGDSVGGVVEAAVFGVQPGLGEPFFDSVESTVASLLFSVPAVKGVEFGEGFRFPRMTGSDANDAILLQDGMLRTATNHNGGILGGITNGMPLRVRVVIKPTPSIAAEQQTVDIATMQPATLTVGGRHDPCIVPRAVVVIEACVALSLLDLMLQSGGGR